MKQRNFILAFGMVVIFCIIWLDCPKIHSENTFKMPEYNKFVLSNGLTVYLMERHKVPLIYVSVVFPAGAVKDNGLYGISSMTADGILFGTKSYKKEQIEEILDFLGVSYNTNANLESASISMSFHSSNQEKVWPILKELIVYPKFDQKEFEKYKRRILLKLRQEKDIPRAVIRAYAYKFIFGEHEYGNPVNGIASTVEKITTKDLENFFSLNYFPDSAAIAIVGDFETLFMKTRITELFSDWKSKLKCHEFTYRNLPTFTQNRVLLIDKKDATETHFVIGSLGIPYNCPDYIPIQVVNTVLGGRFNSWLNDELRVNAGLTYGANSNFFNYKQSGIFVIYSYTRNSLTEKAIDLAVEVLNRLHEKGIDEKTLQSAKNYLKGQFPQRYETGGKLANLLTTIFIYGLNDSIINNFQFNIDSMTIQKTQKIIDKYFTRKNLQFILIGKAVEIKGFVKKYGVISEKNIKDEGF